MVLQWRRVFCTSIPPETVSTAIEELEYDHDVTNGNSTNSTLKCGSRFRLFNSSSNPSTPRLRYRTTATVPTPSPSPSPEPQFETKNSPRLFLTSPRSFIKSNLRLCTRRCGLCLQSVKKGQGTASFTAECSHSFHFPCISDHVKTQGSLACPVCSSLWKEMPLLSIDDDRNRKQLFEEEKREKLAARFIDLKVYNDDEPLASLTPKSRFNPIPESDESCDEAVESRINEFQGFWTNGSGTSPVNVTVRDVEFSLLPEAAVITASRRYETYAVVLKVKAPERVQLRAPIDLVTVLDVSAKNTNNKLQMIKSAMRSIVSSLTSSDRLSIVAFSSQSKRLLPLRRMTTTGRRSVRCIVEAMAVIEDSSRSNSKDAVKKAVKVLLDRREQNPNATVILLSDFSQSVSSIRYSHSRLDVRVHSVNLAVAGKFVGSLLNVVVQDLRLNLTFDSGTSPVAVYSRTPEPRVLGTSTVEIGEMFAGEERELLVELKSPLPAVRSHQVLSVRCRYKESCTQEIIYGNQQLLAIPRPSTVRSVSSSPSIQRLRSLFITTRALAESRRLKEANDITGAYRILVSARVLMRQSKPASANEFVLGLEAELNELHRRLEVAYRDEKGEPLTPTSAWRVADKLAKVAMMRKSVNRVGDLHGFEDARF